MQRVQRIERADDDGAGRQVDMVEGGDDVGGADRRRRRLIV
jgi:hypothetical protein